MDTLTLTLLLGLFSGRTGTCVDASLDRYERVDEETRLAVLDIPEYPSVNVPDTLLEGIPEGTPVKVCAQPFYNTLTISITRDTEREQQIRDTIKRIHEEAE